MRQQIRSFLKLRPFARRHVLYLLLGGWAAACLSPEPARTPAATRTAEKLARASQGPSEVAGFFEPTWGDSAGSDGKGGVKLLVNDDKRLPLVVSDFNQSERGDTITKERPEWLLFRGPKARSLAFDFEWITTADDKFYGKTWAGGGLAFNPAWGAVDATSARHLVLWAKSSAPGVELHVALHSASKAQGKEATGGLNLSNYGTDGGLDTSWRRFVVPLDEFPEIAQVDLNGLQQVMFNLTGGYPENQRVQIVVDNVYLTSSSLVSAVSNLGYLLAENGIHLAWDSPANSAVAGYQINVNGEPALDVPAGTSSVLLSSELLPTVRVSLEVVARGKTDSSTGRIEVLRNAPESKAAEVTLGLPAHEISPYIFGANWGSVAALKGLGVTVRRWGGNRTTKYNWKQDVDSAGSDWYYLNGSGVPAATPEEEKSYFKFIRETHELAADVNFCIPISDWLAKGHPTPGDRYCSFPTSIYPKQESTDGQGCGNGVDANGQKIWGNDQARTMVKNSVAYQRQFVQTLVKHFGTAKAGGVQFYSLDNEPGLWLHTHRDSMPRGVSAERLADLNLAYAAAIKSVDPSATVIGFGAWGVMELAGSSVDYASPGPEGYKREANASERYLERKKHGGDSQLVYLLKRFKQAEAATGQRLIDAIDVHWYAELYAKDSRGARQRVLVDSAYDKQLAGAQWEALREWWDPNFKLAPLFESWTHGENRKYLWDPYHPVIPALTAAIEQHYPGTKLAINEFDTGSRSHYHGALLRAAVLGVFMQENLYMAQPWFESDPSHYTYFAHKLYGNYDGKGARVRGKFVATRSSDEHLLTFATTDAGRYYLVLINKHRTRRLVTRLKLPKAPSVFTTYTLAESMGRRLFERTFHEPAPHAVVQLEPYSATLVVLH